MGKYQLIRKVADRLLVVNNIEELPPDFLTVVNSNPHLVTQFKMIIQVRRILEQESENFLTCKEICDKLEGNQLDYNPNYICDILRFLRNQKWPLVSSRSPSQPGWKFIK